MPGPLPVPEHLRTGHKKPAFQEQELDATARVEYPPLPDADRYQERTREWYRTWGESPQAAQFLATDWQRLQMLAPIVDRYFLDVGDGRPSVVRAAKGTLAEIRASEASLGALAKDRLSLRWKMRTAERAAEREEREEAETPAPKKRGSRSRPDPRLKLVDAGKEG